MAKDRKHKLICIKVEKPEIKETQGENNTAQTRMREKGMRVSCKSIQANANELITQKVARR